MDYTYSGYGNGTSYPNYYHGGLNVSFPAYHSMPYIYHPGLGRDRCLPEKQPESKPRLSKDEVEILETHFRQNPKPPSSVKRELAERMRVELPRINNWFQNRRAKAKQERNQEEYKARQEAAANTTSHSPSQDQSSSVQEHFSLSNQQAPLQPYSASFDISSPDNQTPSSTHPDPETANESPESTTLSVSTQESSAFSHDNELSSVEDSVFSDRNLSVRPSCDDFNTSLDCAPQPKDVVHISMYDELPTCSGPIGDAFQASLELESTQILIPSHGELPPVPSECAGENQQSEMSCSETTSPPMISSPPAPTEFKSPPPAADIARRRNRRPLGLTPFASYHGQPSLRTAAGDIPRRSDTTSPIRRIASATGCAPHRVMKSTTGSAPRSPMFSEQKRDALLHSLQQGRSPVLGLSINAAVAAGPPTPRTPLYPGLQGHGENLVYSANSDEESRVYSYQQAQVASFVKPDDPSMKTPPGTPGVVGFPESLYAPNAIESAYNYVAPREEPVFTPGVPGHGGFPPELDFHASLAAPEYVASSAPSQPATPSFPAAGMGATCFAGGVTGNEYNWPESAMTQYGLSIRSSPGSKSKTFQFTPNMTPQHFNAEK